MKTFLTILILVLSTGGLHAQSGCTVLGQTPQTAFPVCGSSVFRQKSVPLCTNGAVPVPSCRDSASYADKNPFWYTFTCFKGGTLSFLIRPNNNGDDYDWQLYDITGHNPSEVYTKAGLIVSANWSGTYGNTGATAGGVSFTQCASDPKDRKPSFAKSPVLIAGHRYLLLISHFTDSQSGYTLSFGGGTAVITDTTAPHLKTALASCDGSAVTVMLSKAFQCGSLAADGSDFILSPDSAAVTAASSSSCSGGFDLQSLVLTLSRPLPDGDYTLTIKDGNDGNTLLDDCGNGIPEGETLRFSVHKTTPTPLDTVVRPGCAPAAVTVVFGGAIRCSSIAADGSDFTLTGPWPARITGASVPDCTAGSTTDVVLQLDRPLLRGGTFTVTLVKGTDGNSLLNPCGNESVPGQAVHFTTADTVHAVIGLKVQYACDRETVDLHAGTSGITQWSWTGSCGTSSLPDVTYADTSFGPQVAHLLVSNGVCSDTASAAFAPDASYFVKAAFEAPSFVCPRDEVTFSDHSEGQIASYDWDFGNGQTSFLAAPPKQHYPSVVRSRNFPVRLVVENVRGCRDTVLQQLQVINNCLILVPTAFTPNGDGMNDYLYPLNAYKARDLDFRVYNRYGQLVFQTRDWTARWDGSFHGTPQPTGSYVWMLRYTNGDTGAKVFKKGSTVLIR